MTSRAPAPQPVDRPQLAARRGSRISRWFRPFRRSYGLLFRHRPTAIWVGIACVVLAALASLALPILAGRIIDTARLDPENYSGGSVLPLCLAFAALAALDVGFRFLARRQLIDASRVMEERLKADLVGHIESLPVAWSARARTGDLLSRLTQDVELVRFITGPLLLHGGQSLVVVPGGIYLMFALSPWIAGAALLSFTVLFLALRFLLPQLQRASQEIQESIAALSQRTNEAFSGIRVLQTLGVMSAETERVRGQSQDYLQQTVRTARIQAKVNMAIHGSLELVVVAGIAVGAVEAIRGNLSIGELLQYYSLLGIMMWPLLALGWLTTSLPRAAAAAIRIEEVFAIRPAPVDGASPENLDCSVQVVDLTFCYPGEEQPVLQNLSFELRSGESLGIVGPVGSGKTTLLALLMRFYDPPPATIFVGGHDVLTLAPECLRAQFGYAAQQPFLFSDSIANNIAFGDAVKPGGSAASSKRVASAIQTACLENDLAALPNGVDTIIGVRGVTLSGGQRQRVALARALVANRPGLLLDDTLSAVDHATERRILARLHDDRESVTSIVVSHRLSAVRRATEILVLEGGRISARGTHTQLLAAAGPGHEFYSRAWRTQTESFALDGQLDRDLDR